jgi:hypothetical protein
MRRVQIGKEEIKLSLFADNRILYLKDTKRSTRKLLNWINFVQSSRNSLKIPQKIKNKKTTKNRTMI